MSRSREIWGYVLGVGAVLVWAGDMLVWPRYAAVRHRAVEAARSMAIAEAGVPATAVDQARVETLPTANGWRVVFRDVQVPCSQTQFRCVPPDGRPSGFSSDQVFRDVLVCVEYGTARGYFIAGMLRPVAGVTWRGGSAGCQTPLPPSQTPTT